MFTFLKNLFKKPLLVPMVKPEDANAKWVADLRNKETGRFQCAQEDRYSAQYLDGSLELRLLAPNLFAWTEAPSMGVSDFSLEAEIVFHIVAGGTDDESATCAAGFIVRMTDQSSFMYVLVSDTGAVRLDAVFNGDPQPVAAWTECPWVDCSEPVNLTLVARGSRYTVLLNGRFAMEADDETVASGTLAFAAQTYADTQNAGFELKSLTVETRPVEVEVDFVRFARILPADVDQRVRLTETFMAMGKWVSALVQIRKLEDRGELDAKSLFLRGECLLQQGMQEDAEGSLLQALEKDPDFDQAREEYYNVLYLRGRYLVLRTSLEGDAERLEKSPRLQNLLGHARFNLGDWTGAAQAYTAAARMEPTMPIYELNAARAWEQAGEKSDAAGAWLAASRGFFAQGSYDDATECLQHLRLLKYDPSALASLEGRIAYAKGDFAEAESIFSRLVKKDKADAPSAYLFGLMMSGKGKSDDAIRAFRMAAELDRETAIYQYRLAEALFLADQDCAEALEHALAANPEDGWTQNLAGLVELKRGNDEGALEFFRRAHAILPGERDIGVNLADALSRMGEVQGALSVLDAFGDDAAAANARGNINARAGHIEKAVQDYEAACRLALLPAPQHGETVTPLSLAEYRTNLAACYIETERWFDAEEELRRSLEINEADVRTLTLMGDVWDQIGDAPRAELSWRTAMQIAEGRGKNPEPMAGLLKRLAEHYLVRGKYKQAEDAAAQLASFDQEKADEVRRAITKATSRDIACSQCERKWTVPWPVPVVPRTRIHGELADDSPAGSCPSCGRIYCVACRKDAVVDGRFTCPGCGENLNLNDDAVRWILHGMLKKD